MDCAALQKVQRLVYRYSSERSVFHAHCVCVNRQPFPSLMWCLLRLFTSYRRYFCLAFGYRVLLAMDFGDFLIALWQLKLLDKSINLQHTLSLR